MYFIRVPPSVSRTARARIDSSPEENLQSDMTADATTAVEEVYRSEWGRIVATLIRLVGDFDLAEESAQEAFAAAVDQWPVSGVPEFPRDWIIQTARHKAIDRIRHRTRSEEKLELYAASGFVNSIQKPDYDTREIPDD